RCFNTSLRSLICRCRRASRLRRIRWSTTWLFVAPPTRESRAAQRFSSHRRSPINYRPMPKNDAYTPRPEHHFTFGLWTVGNVGRDPFGDAVRPTISPTRIVERLAALGAYGVNLHDN